MTTLTRFIFLTAGALMAMTVTSATAVGAQEAVAPVEVVTVEGVVDPTVAGTVAAAIAAGEAAGSRAVVLVLDSPGVVSVGPSLVTPVVESRVPVVVHVPAGAEAAGGAAFLAAAADVVVMAPDATLGPAVPFELSAGEPGSRDPATDGLSDYTSLWRLLDLPDRRARRVGAELAARALSSQDAVALGIADVVVTSDAQLMTAIGVPPDAPVRIHEPTPVRRLLHAVASPAAAFLLLLFSTLCMLMLFVWPATAKVALSLATPLAVVALVVLPAHWWAILLTVGGVLVIAIDVGLVWLGVPTVVGTAMLVLGGRSLIGGASVLRVPVWLVAAAALLAVAASLTARQRRTTSPETEQADDGGALAALGSTAA